MDISLRKTFFQALLGWSFWGIIVRMYRIKESLCVLLPAHDPETSFYAIKLLDKAVQIRGLKNSLVITTDGRMRKAIEAISTSVLNIVVCSEESRECLLQYSAYTGIDVRFINASISEPSARLYGPLLGFRNITKESIVAYGIYGIMDYESRDKDGKEYEQFLKFINCECEEELRK